MSIYHDHVRNIQTDRWSHQWCQQSNNSSVDPVRRLYCTPDDFLLNLPYLTSAPFKVLISSPSDILRKGRLHSVWETLTCSYLIDNVHLANSSWTSTESCLSAIMFWRWSTQEWMFMMFSAVLWYHVIEVKIAMRHIARETKIVSHII